MRNSIIALSIALAASSFTATASDAIFGDTTDGKTADQVKLEAVTPLQNDVNLAQSEVASLDSEVTVLQGEYTAKQTALADATVDFDAAKAAYEADTDDQALQDAFNAATQAKNLAQQEFDAVQGSLATKLSDKSDAEAALTTAQNALTAAEGKTYDPVLSTAQKNEATLDAEGKSLYDYTQSNATDAAAAKTVADNAQATADDAQAGVDAINNKLGFDARDDGDFARIVDLENADKDLQDAVTKLDDEFKQVAGTVIGDMTDGKSAEAVKQEAVDTAIAEVNAADTAVSEAGDKAVEANTALTDAKAAEAAAQAAFDADGSDDNAQALAEAKALVDAKQDAVDAATQVIADAKAVQTAKNAALNDAQNADYDRVLSTGEKNAAELAADGHASVYDKTKANTAATVDNAKAIDDNGKADAAYRTANDARQVAQEQAIYANTYANQRQDAQLADHEGRINLLEQGQAQLRKDLNSLEDRVDGTQAMTMAALSSTAQIHYGQTSSIGFGVGTAGDAQALAIGGAYRITENWTGKVHVAATIVSGDFEDVAAGAGAAYSW